MKRINLNFSFFLLAAGRRRRRQYSSPPESSLTRVLRQKRQSTTYNLPASYTINLPLSCCKSGGTTIGNSLGGCKHLHLD
jgi:hypothetical protein